LWFLGVPITVRNYAIVFFVSFATTYFIIGFFGHHYLKPIAEYVSDYVEDHCPGSVEPAYDDADPDALCMNPFPLYNDIAFKPER
jgi:hypothetical protein